MVVAGSSGQTGGFAQDNESVQRQDADLLARSKPERMLTARTLSATPRRDTSNFPSVVKDLMLLNTTYIDYWRVVTFAVKRESPAHCSGVLPYIYTRFKEQQRQQINTDLVPC